MRLLSLSLLLLLGSRVAIGCSCGQQPTALEALPRATAVFDGTVVSRTPFLAHVHGYLAVLDRTEFVVHQAWRGPNQEHFVVVGGFGNCDYLFRVGTRYLVFATPYKNAALGLGATICLPTQVYQASSQASRDLGQGLAFAPFQSPGAESSFARARRAVRASFLYGVATSVTMFSGHALLDPPWQWRALVAPVTAFVSVVVSLFLVLRHRYRLLAVLSPALLLAVLVAATLQGYLVIQLFPDLSLWFLGTAIGA